MKLLMMNDPALRQVCDPVKPDELDYIKSLLPDMTKLLEFEEGAALAANQVGVIKRFFLMKDGTLILNPEIMEISQERDFEEGCLSIPGTYAKIKRGMQIKVKYRDADFNEVEKELSGVEAVAFQHEIDHLDGKLYIDKLNPMQKALTLQKHKQFLKMKGKR